jgi:hypothetical protein
VPEPVFPIKVVNQIENLEFVRRQEQSRAFGAEFNVDEILARRGRTN